MGRKVCTRMQEVRLSPTTKRRRRMLGGIILLTVCTLISPLLALPATLLMGLFVVPLRPHKEFPLALGIATLPALGFLLHQNATDLYYCISIVCVLSALFFWRAPDAIKTPLHKLMQYYLTMYSLLVVALLVYFSILGNGNLYDYFVTTMVTSIKNTPSSTQLLTLLSQYGLVSLPATSLTTAYNTQLLLSLSNTLYTLLPQALPNIAVHAVLFPSIFVAFRTVSFNCVKVQHLKDSVLVVEPPLFRQFVLPKTITYLAYIAALVSFFLIFSANTQTLPFAFLCYSLFQCSFVLQGMATVLFIATFKQSERKRRYGILIGVGYLLFPALFLLVGILESSLHLRAKISQIKGENT